MIQLKKKNRLADYMMDLNKILNDESEIDFPEEAGRLRVYISTATSPMSDQDLAELLQKARQKNVLNHITGLLLYCEGFFLQAFEGPRESVEDLHNKIAQDPRHHSMHDLMVEEIRRRSFAEWSMGLGKATRESLVGIEGMSDYLTSGQIPNINANRRAVLLLDYFRKTKIVD